MPKILLIDDDKDLVEMVKEWLEAANYNYEIAHDGKAGWEFLRQGIYDVIVIDWNLPGMEGPEICRKFRANRGTTPIIMLTGKTQIEDKETGLDSGADDYLTKPFSIKELMARIRAQLRRQNGKFAQTIKVGDLEMAPTNIVSAKMAWKSICSLKTLRFWNYLCAIQATYSAQTPFCKESGISTPRWAPMPCALPSNVCAKPSTKAKTKLFQLLRTFLA